MLKFIKWIESRWLSPACKSPALITACYWGWIVHSTLVGCCLSTNIWNTQNGNKTHFCLEVPFCTRRNAGSMRTDSPTKSLQCLLKWCVACFVSEVNVASACAGLCKSTVKYLNRLCIFITWKIWASGLLFHTCILEKMWFVSV